jgi:hypothetical protein
MALRGLELESLRSKETKWAFALDLATATTWAFESALAKGKGSAML